MAEAEKTEKEDKREKKKKINEKKMSFIEHLEELRWVLIKSIASVIIFSIVSYIFSEQLVNFLIAPYPFTLIALGPADAFMLRINLSITTAVIISLPVIIYQLWKFIAPGLLAREKRFVPWMIFFTIFCFLTGALFCYYVILRSSLEFLASFQTGKLIMNVSIDRYVSFVTLLLISFGISFELPMVSILLAKIGLLKPDFLKKIRGYAIVVIFIAAAVITPSTDAFTMCALAFPLLILYEVSIWLTKIFAKKSEEDFEKEFEETDEEEEKKSDENGKEVYGEEYD
jgi:sec-independent protein translocase protein TatC